jgi:hypothetical protein
MWHFDPNRIEHPNAVETPVPQYHNAPHRRGMVRPIVGVLALGAAAGLAVGAYNVVQNIDFDMPWDDAHVPKVDLSEPKKALDDAVASITQREAEPLYIDPKDVVMGKVEGATMQGKAERELRVLKAEKKYNSPVPLNDEWIRLQDGVYMLESHVAGTTRVVMDEHTRKLTVILEKPTNNNDIRVVQEPRISDRPQLGPQIGQVPGAETSATAAQKELFDFVKAKQSNDPELDKAASCWAIKGVADTTRGILEATGFEVTMGSKVPNIDPVVAQQNPAMINNLITVDVVAAAKQDTKIIGPTMGESWTSCIPIIAATTPANGKADGGVLAARQTNDVALKQASK